MSIDWGKLKIQNRVKEVGIPWNEKELDAIHKLKIPADYVRQGVLTLEDYEKVKDKPIKSREDIETEAKEAGIEFTSEADSSVLEKEIAKNKKAKAAKKAVKAKK